MTSVAKSDSNAWKSEALSSVDARHTMLFVIDIQRDFCSPDGALAALGSDVSPCTEIAARIFRKCQPSSDYLPFYRRTVLSYPCVGVRSGTFAGAAFCLIRAC
jgi:hypothetical protein